MEIPGSTFISNHALVLSYIFHNSSHTAREIARHVDATERTTHKIISNLEAAGYIERRKSGRRNIYSVDPALPLRHHTKQDILISALLDALTVARLCHYLRTGHRCSAAPSPWASRLCPAVSDGSLRLRSGRLPR